MGGRVSTVTTSSTEQPTPVTGDRSSRGATTTTTHAQTGDGDQRDRAGAPTPPPRSAARPRAGRPTTIHDTDHAAGAADHLAERRPHQARRARRPARAPSPAPPRARPAGWPRTATRLTWPEIAVTTRGARDLGGQRHRRSPRRPTGAASACIASRHAGARNRMPAVASTDSANPAVTASPGRRSSSATTAAPRHRVPRSPPVAAHPDQRDGPHRRGPHDARLGPGDQDEADDAERADDVHPPAAHAAPAAPTISRNPTSRVRLVPDTASRWVSPVVAEVVGERGSRPLSSPTTSAGTSSPGVVAPGRTESRTTPAPRPLPATNVGPGSSSADRAPTGPRARGDPDRRRAPADPGPGPADPSAHVAASSRRPAPRPARGGHTSHRARRPASAPRARPPVAEPAPPRPGDHSVTRGSRPRRRRGRRPGRPPARCRTERPASVATTASAGQGAPPARASDLDGHGRPDDRTECSTRPG